jgi:hypothetical protein
MDWVITIEEKNKFIEVITKGIADKDGSMEMAKTIAETLRHHRITKAIIDHRNITGISGEVIDVYERPNLFRLIGVIFRIKLAAIINPDHTEHFKFLETVSINHGYKYSVFYDRTSALKWLLEK